MSTRIRLTRTRLLALMAGAGAVVMTVSGTAAGSPAAPTEAPRHGDSRAAPQSYLPGFVLDKGRYRVFDSPRPRIGLFPAGINDRREVVGEYLRPNSESGLFRGRRGRISSFDVPGAKGTEAVRINDRGQIVGEYSNDTPYVNDSAFVRAYVTTQRGRFIRLRVGRAPLTTAAGINDRGRVVGAYVKRGTPQNPDGTYQEAHGYVWKHGRFRTFDVPGASVTELYEINNHGDMIGVFVDRRTGEQHGFLRGRHGRITEIDVRGGQVTLPFGINDRRQIVGYTADIAPDGTPINIHGFALLRGVHGPITRIDVPGAPQTAALGINDRGQIVGAYENPDATGLRSGRTESMPLGAVLPIGLGAFPT